MTEMSMGTIAIVVIFIVIAALAIIFVMNVYSEARESGESQSETVEEIIGNVNTGISGAVITDIQTSNS